MAKIPLHVITGFLGVGKTTAILDLLARLGDSQRVAVVVNERGQVNLDGAVMASAQPGLAIREVTGGCICCTAGAAFDAALTEVVERVAPDRIIVEPSGLAKPGEVVDLFHAHRLGRGLELRPVITLVDPVRFLNPKVKAMPVYRDQVEAGDILVANRCDQVDQDTLEEFRRAARGLFPPKARVLTTSFGQLPQEVLELTCEQARVTKAVPMAILEAPRPAGQPGHELFEEQGWTWPPAAVFRKGDLEALLADLAAGRADIQGRVERLKGVFHCPDGWWLLEVALDQVHARPSQHRRDSRCQAILSQPGPGDFDRIAARLELSLAGADTK